MSGDRRLVVLCRHVQPTHGPHPCPTLHPQQTAALPALGRALAASYDYIVVGAGSAGCVAASRLSEDPSVSVLLIEAGGSNQNYKVRWPVLTCQKLQTTEMDWCYRTEAQETTDGRVSYWPRGKCLGGSSSINSMLYVRGDPRNYDHWAQHQGCTGWSYEEVLPFFKKSENLIGPDRGGCGLHGRGGPLQVSQMSEAPFASKELCERILRSSAEVGLPAPTDYNGRAQRGGSLSQVTIKDGVRNDTASAFLFATGALDRPNLTVLSKAAAQRIVLTGDRATGVCVKREGEAGPPLLVSASREVVVCCGAIGTPQLLMLSGLGPLPHLREHGIDCLRDLPVGENLQDHFMWPVIYPLKPGHTSSISTKRPLSILPHVFEYLTKGTGILSHSTVQGMLFDHSGLPDSPEEEGNDIQVHFTPFSAGGTSEDMEQYFGLRKREDRPLSDPSVHPADGITFLPTIVLPKSTGTVRLASPDPNQHPIIDPRYLSHPHDIQVCIACTKLVRRVAAASQLSEVLEPELIDPSIPHDPSSDDYVAEHIRRNCITVYHPVGTAKMGAADDPTAVVDPRLRVRGVRGLRVADASVMPTVTSGNTNAPSIMIGERVAAFIQEERS